MSNNPTDLQEEEKPESTSNETQPGVSEQDTQNPAVPANLPEPANPASDTPQCEVDSSSDEEPTQSPDPVQTPETDTDDSSSKIDHPLGSSEDGSDPTIGSKTESNVPATESAQVPEGSSTNENQAESTEYSPDVAEAPNKTKIKIGSQRNPGQDENLVPKAVKDAKENSLANSAQQEAAEPAEIGPSVQDLSAQWEQEAESILQEDNVGKLMESATLGADSELAVNTRVKGTVTKIHGDNVFFLLKGQFDGYVPVKQFKKEPEPGTMTDVVVSGFNNDDNLYELSLPGAAVSVADWSDLEVGKRIEVRITGSNTGGLECNVNNIRGFIPASQIDISRVDNLGAFVNQTLECVITEANKKKKNLVLSRRAILEKELKERKKEILDQFEVGKTLDGKITKLRDFGAFVDIGQGVEGLVHISKCSWHHIKHPSEVFEEGQQVTVRIEKINKETGKIQLSHRDTVEHPWKRVSEKYPVESTVSATVSKIADFGAFIKLETGIEGLVHISEIAHERVKSVAAVLSEGQQVEVKILSVDPDKQKMALSIKALLPVPEKEPNSENAESKKEPAREMAVKKRNRPLKGGTSESAGGNQFGLKW